MYEINLMFCCRCFVFGDQVCILNSPPFCLRKSRSLTGEMANLMLITEGEMNLNYLRTGLTLPMEVTLLSSVVVLTILSI